MQAECARPQLRRELSEHLVAGQIHDEVVEGGVGLHVGVGVRVAAAAPGVHVDERGPQPFGVPVTDAPGRKRGGLALDHLPYLIEVLVTRQVGLGQALAGRISAALDVLYVPEGTWYGPHENEGDAELMLIQYGGNTGSGFLTYDELAAGFERLESRGTFTHGIFRPEGAPDGSAAGAPARNQDGYEAIWEEVTGAPGHLPLAPLP